MRSTARLRSAPLLALLVGALAGGLPAHAGTAGATDVTAAGQRVRAGARLAVFGINLQSATGDTLSQVKVTFAQVGSDTDFAASDLAGPAADPEGVALYRDDSLDDETEQDRLDPADTRVSASFGWTGGLEATLTIDPPAPIPASGEGEYTFILAIKTSDTISEGDDFTATLALDSFSSSLVPTLFLGSPVTTKAIRADVTAPVASLRPVASDLVANLVWEFSEPVRGVGGTNVVLRVQGSTAPLPATVTYDASDPATPTAVLDPAAPFTVGQRYETVVAPDGTPPITDVAGNAVVTAVGAFRAGPLDVGERVFGTRYYWPAVRNSYAYGGSYTVNNLNGTRATFSWDGTSITWYTMTDPYQGKAVVSVDGRTIATVNNYSSTTKHRVARTFSGFSRGRHSIVISVPGVKGSSVGKDTRVSIDAFKVGSTLFTTPSVTYQWRITGAIGASGGSYAACALAGCNMYFTFYGRGVDWKTVFGPAMGRALVYVDGVLAGGFDNYLPVTVFGDSWQLRGLPEGLHTLRIVALGTRDRASKGTLIAVDGFRVS